MNPRRVHTETMPRARKHHVQQELPRLDKNGQRRGGARKGAGRPPRGKRASEPHKKREVFKPSQPVHVVIRAVDAVGARFQTGAEQHLDELGRGHAVGGVAGESPRNAKGSSRSAGRA